ncbi:pre-mRNA 3' end processing protein WDR33-like, partial [Anarrhichthys ocellatus]|uniref:pre-mRNA 3' end processing protein WDR33-like n=1 Tax=Anarrhichthys ocellatus TaxID=433405 RepID=UPI0012EDB70B
TSSCLNLSVLFSLCFSKFWTRNRPGDKMRDRYNLNLLPGMSEDGMEYDDVDLNSVASIPGMGIPEQLKAAMELEQSSKEAAPEVEMSIPGLDWGMDEVMGKDSKKVPQKKVPYAKPIPAQFQQAWAENKVPMMPPGGEMSKDRKVEQKVDGKKKTQSEMEQEMAYTNPMLLEQMKMDRMNQMNTDGNMGPQQGQGPMPPFPGGPGVPMPPGQQGFPPNMPPQQMPNNMGPPMGPGGMQPPFMSPGQMGPPSGPQSHQGPTQGNMGPPDMQRHPGPPRNMGPQGPHGMGPRGMQGPHGGMMGPPPRGMGPRDPQGPPPQGNMMGPQGGMMGPPPRTHGNAPNNYGMGNMQGPPGGLHGPPGNMQGPPGNMQGPHGNMQGAQGNIQGPHGNMQGPPYMQHQNSGPMMHGMGQQGPNNKDPRGPPPNHHMGPSDRQGPGGPDQGSSTYWGDNQQGRRGPQDFDGGQEFHGRGEEGWRPGPGPGYQGGGGGGHRGGGHRGGGGGGNAGNWGPEERFTGGEFRGRRDERFRGGGPGRLGARGYSDEYGSQEEGFDGPEEMGRGWDNGGRGRPPRGGGPPRGGHDSYRDGQQQMHDGSSPTGRERSASLQGMDMASLPPRKRPWQDGPGTGDPRERESPGADGGRPPLREDGGYGPSGRGGRGGWGPGGPGPVPRRGGPAPRVPPRGGSRGR